MVAEGLITVVNAPSEDAARAFTNLSPNFLPAEESVEALADGLHQAVARGDADRTPANALAWPRTPEEAFDAEWMGAFTRLLHRSLKVVTEER
jgi:hypothetical protein